MEKIKSFFDEKKKEKTFKKAGGGYRLSEEARKPSSSHSHAPSTRAEPGDASKTAGAAAIDRFDDRSKPKPTFKSTPKPTPTSTFTSTSKSVSSTDTVDEVKPKPVEISLDPTDPEFMKMLSSDPIARAVYDIKINNPEDKSRVCLSTLKLYMQNIISSPKESKYRKIRVGNNAYQTRVQPCVDAANFFAAVGFKSVEEDYNGSRTEFLVLPENVDTTVLEVAIAMLSNPPVPPVHRQRILYSASDRPNIKWELPDFFYRITADDVKKAQTALTDKMERELTLRTRAMREKENLSRNYRLTCLRIRMPDGHILQGTFRPRESIRRVVGFINHACVSPVPLFRLYMSTDSENSLCETPEALLCDLGLVPKAVLNLQWISSDDDESGLLLPELLETCRSL
eukprot:CFRG6617T1